MQCFVLLFRLSLVVRYSVVFFFLFFISDDSCMNYYKLLLTETYSIRSVWFNLEVIRLMAPTSFIHDINDSYFLYFLKFRQLNQLQCNYDYNNNEKKLFLFKSAFSMLMLMLAVGIDLILFFALFLCIFFAFCCCSRAISECIYDMHVRTEHV